MGQRKRRTSKPKTPVYHIKFDPNVVREFYDRKKREEEPPSSSVAAPKVFAIFELAARIMLYLSPQDLLRSQQVNKTFHQIITTHSLIKQRLFLAPNLSVPTAWNPFVRCAQCSQLVKSASRLD